MSKPLLAAASALALLVSGCASADRSGPGAAAQASAWPAFSQGFIESGKVSYASAMAVLMMIATVITFTMLWKRVQA